MSAMLPIAPPCKKISPQKPIPLPRPAYTLNKYNKASLKWARANDMYWSGKEWVPNSKSQKNNCELTEEEIHRNNRIVAQKLADASKLAAIEHWTNTSGGYIEDLLTEEQWRNV